MARTTGSRSRSRRPSGADKDSAQAARDTAQQIWLAGLGAFERARTEGPRMFESLVERGRNMGARAVGVADEVLKEMRQANYSGVPWDKLERTVQEKVTQSLGKLGLMTGRDVEELSRQVRELNERMESMMATAARTATKGAARATRKAAHAATKAASATAKTPSAATRARARRKKAAARRNPPSAA